MKNKPAGWYRNSEDPRQHGYWDGLAWVEPPVEDLPAEADSQAVGHERP
jgi:hypothetical protein